MTNTFHQSHQSHASPRSNWHGIVKLTQQSHPEVPIVERRDFVQSHDKLHRLVQVCGCFAKPGLATRTSAEATDGIILRRNPGTNCFRSYARSRDHWREQHRQCARFLNDVSDRVRGNWICHRANGGPNCAGVCQAAVRSGVQSSREIRTCHGSDCRRVIF